MQSRIPNWLLVAIILAALVGFGDSAFLLSKHISGAPIPCFIVTGCDSVTNSAYSFFLGIPVSAIGVVFYLSMGFLVMLYWDTKKTLFLKLISVGTVVCLLASLYFLYIQAFVLREYCVYCLISAITSATLFTLGMILLKKLRTPEVLA